MISAVIVAGGRGLRMRNDMRKQYLSLGGKPILVHTLLAFDQCDMIDQIFLVLPPDDIAFCRRNLLSCRSFQKRISFVAGGSKRQQSVYNGLLAMGNAVGNQPDHSVLIHDAVRPFLTCKLIRACMEGAKKYGACIPAIAAFDTLKQIDSQGIIRETIPRKDIFLAQTPQAFHYQLIRQAHEYAVENNMAATDDASLVEAIGGNVTIIEGDRLNIKITTPDDLLLAEAIFASIRRA
jgi:2-C-methyl-D-erythritol 4-phosphate cytidylyltransferase